MYVCMYVCMYLFAYITTICLGSLELRGSWLRRPELEKTRRKPLSKALNSRTLEITHFRSLWTRENAKKACFQPHFGRLSTSKSMLPCRRELDFQKIGLFDAEFEKGLQKCPPSSSKRSRGIPRSVWGRPQDSPGAARGTPRGSKGSRPASRTSPQGLRQAWRLHFDSIWEPFLEDCRSRKTLVRRMSGISQRLRRGHSG